ncbi:hypothetical protein L665_01289 [Ralstonia solanacearum SD54]|nr:hypothetical protein F504_1817 [Ralstonia pseudosolanacearum FQY_4]ANH32858.1 hypothetical protein A3768_1703 [Ralstonia solanacearum]ARU23585.1 hypothetical protein RSSE_c3201 [Ralstonia solanacearum]ESS50089.1 hypothetical protein L665_01289 [Ralstonia solanacearum SD54]
MPERPDRASARGFDAGLEGAPDARGDGNALRIGGVRCVGGHRRADLRRGHGGRWPAGTGGQRELAGQRHDVPFRCDEAARYSRGTTTGADDWRVPE